MANGTQTFDFDNSAARLRYFLGQVLTQRDLQLEQSYHVMLQRLLQREAFGTGTVVGLDVRGEDDEGGSVAQSVLVSPGLAFDPDGRELILERVAIIEVAAPPLLPPGDTAFSPVPATLDELADATADRFLGAALNAFNRQDLDALAARLVEAGFLANATDVAPLRQAIELLEVPTVSEQPVVAPPELLGDWLFENIIGITYVGLTYRETGTAPAPATLDASCCGERMCFPSRTQEGVRFVTSSSGFPALPDPYLEFKLTLDQQFFTQIDGQGGTNPAQLDCHAALCAALVSGRPGALPWRGVPRVTFPCGDIAFPVVPLARVYWRRFVPDDDEAPQILAIDNCTFRPLAPGIPALRALVESLTACANPPLLAPRITSITPAHESEVLVGDTAPDPPGDRPRLTLVAQVNAQLETLTAGNPDDLNLWEIVFYPAAGTDDKEIFTPTGAGNPADGPGGSKVTVSFAAGAGFTTIVLAFDGGSTFTPGTYVWRLLNGTPNSGGTASTGFAEATTGVQLDGDPRPQGAVPSGDGKPGGAFEARFFVRV